MKQLKWLVAILVLAVGGMGAVYGVQTFEMSREVARRDSLWERQSVVRDLSLALEEYRRLSGGFRKLTEAARVQTKENLKKEISTGIARLEELDPTDEEKALGQSMNQKLGDFMVLSAKLEPMLFTRDVYLKPEAQRAHELMLQTLNGLKESGKNRLVALRGETQDRRMSYTRIFAAAAVGVLVVTALILVSFFFAYQRPVRRLARRAREIQKGKLRREVESELTGTFSEIEGSMDELATMVDSQRRERQQFITAVATDLRVPLMPLQASATLLASSADQLKPEEKADAAEMLRRSAARLSRSLDDLTDTQAIEQGEILLEERISDLRDVIAAASAMMTGPGASHDVQVFAPSTAIWAFVDPKRLERVMIQLISKIMQYSPQGGRIELSLSKYVRSGVPNGVEISIHDSRAGHDQERNGAPRPTGPEQNLLRHWISENGFGLSLAQRIVESHGGSVTAAGISGTSVLFTIRLPEERIVSGSAMRPGFKTVLRDSKDAKKSGMLQTDLRS